MNRTLWFVAGAGAGVYAVIRGRRAAEALTADGLADRLQGAAVGLRIFREEVAAGRAEKETELRERLAAVPPGSLTAPTTPELTSPPEHPEHPEHQEEGTT